MAADSRIDRYDPVRLARAVRFYRVMAYVTGVVLIVLVFAGIPLQFAAHNDVIVNDVGTTHGILYLIYLAVAFYMTRQVRMRTATPGTLIVLLAGTIPVLTFVVERWVTRTYINPALQAAGIAPGHSGPAPASPPADTASAPAVSPTPQQPS